MLTKKMPALYGLMSTAVVLSGSLTLWSSQRDSDIYLSLFSLVFFCLLSGLMASVLSMRDIALKPPGRYPGHILAYTGVFLVAALGFCVFGYPIMFNTTSGIALHMYLFHMLLAALAMSIFAVSVSGRISRRALMGFSLLFLALVYPTTGLWVWGKGWLAEMGFVDFAGATVVHSAGGWAALVGSIVLGQHRSRAHSRLDNVTFPCTSFTLTTVSIFILWFGWFGFGQGEVSSLAHISDMTAVFTIFANSNAAAFGGLMAVLVINYLLQQRSSMPEVFNGALAGLVSISADPMSPGSGLACLIGVTGGLVMVIGGMVAERFQINDDSGVIAVHLGAGIWGSLIVVLSNTDASFDRQFIGVVCIGATIVVGSLAIWAVLNALLDIRSQQCLFKKIDIHSNNLG